MKLNEAINKTAACGSNLVALKIILQTAEGAEPYTPRPLRVLYYAVFAILIIQLSEKTKPFSAPMHMI